MENSFWSIVQQAKEMSDEDWTIRPASLNELLLTLSADQVLAFYQEYQSKLIAAYRWDLWGAVYLIKGGCSDDCFAYFCDWLISEGQEAFDKALSDPDSLAVFDDLSEVELEEYRYSIFEAYEELAGQEINEGHLSYPAVPTGTQWEDDDLPKMFPNLAAKYPLEQ